MSALAALALGLVGVAYAVWPAWRTPAASLSAGSEPSGDAPAEADAEAVVRALRAWSQAAGELRGEGPGSDGSAGAAT